ASLAVVRGSVGRACKWPNKTRRRLLETISPMANVRCDGRGVLSPLPRGEGGPLPALLRAGAGRVRGLSGGTRFSPNSRNFFTNSSGFSITLPFGKRSSKLG